MRIAEMFRSIQGEGRLTGTESLFVRTSGCNLRCRWCDTPYASWTPEGEDVSVAEILDRAEQLAAPTAESPGVSHVVLTGGEPMLLAELIPLSARLHADGWHITIETSGTLYLPVACDLMSISPKLSNSTPPPEQDPQWTWRHTLNRHAPEVIRRLTAQYDYQLKFVIDCLEDCREVETYLREFPEIPRSRVMLMPQGIEADLLAEKTAWLVPYCDQHGFQFCPRRQIEWFGVARGT
jgi:7-carboxy-7-deazaguanine synthase